MEESGLLKGFSLSITLLAGYILIRCSPYRRYRSEHLRTDRYAMHLLRCALFVYVIGVAIDLVADTYLTSNATYRFWLAKSTKYTTLDEPIIYAVLVAPLLGTLDRMLIMLRLSREATVRRIRWRNFVIKSRTAALAKFVRQCDDAAIRLLHRATFYRKPLLITLSSGKVYIGEPIGGLGDPTVKAQSIKLIPLAGGYRKSETHKVEITTRYSELRQNMVLREKDKDDPEDPLGQDIADLSAKDGTTVAVDFQDMGIVILWSEIQTLSLWDPNIYQAFQDSGQSKETEGAMLF